jgi:hypothetical protein
MLIISILILHFINRITKTTKKLYEKHNIHERYTYEYICQTYISTKSTTRTRCINVSATKGRASNKNNYLRNKC